MIIDYVYLVAQLLYNSKCPSAFGGKGKFLANIPLSNEHLLYNYLVCLYVGDRFTIYGHTCFQNDFAQYSIWFGIKTKSQGSKIFTHK